jgi:putative (di)nucleoside polyphosphate hydrolase
MESVEQYPAQLERVWDSVIDADGFRPNVGIILANDQGRLLWARRVGQDAWQFPQGGIAEGESPEDALYRELMEEVGLGPDAVRVMGCTRGWLRYRLPKRYIRKGQKPLCIGQKQKWFLLHMLADDDAVTVDHHPKPEFDHWRWVSYWYPLTQVISFKREVYRSALKELASPCARISTGGRR